VPAARLRVFSQTGDALFYDSTKSSRTLARSGFLDYCSSKELIGLRPAGLKSGPTSGWRMAWENDFIGLPLSDDPKDVPV
jgi:hypothetical protein